MTPFRRFGLLPLAAAVGVGLSLPAGAETTGDREPAPDPCAGVFEAPITAGFGLTTDPPPRSDARPGQEIRLTGTWPATAWDSVTSLVSCVEVARAVDPSLGAAEQPPVNDGLFTRTFAVPDGFFNGTVICTRMRMAGDPAGEATEATWIGKQACFEVHPEEAPPPPPPAPPPTGPEPEPAPAPEPEAAPSEPAGSPPPPAAAPAPRPAPPAPVTEVDTRAVAAPEPREGDGDVPGADASAPPGVGPIPLAELPRTGPGPTGLAAAGAAAVAAGLPLVLAGRRRRRP